LTWAVVDWRKVDDYGLTHLPAHALGARADGRSPDDLFGLIVETFMREKFHRFGTHGSFAADVALIFPLDRSGPQFVIVCLDTTDAVAESDETNNCADVPTTFCKPQFNLCVCKSTDLVYCPEYVSCVPMAQCFPWEALRTPKLPRSWGSPREP